MVLTDFNLDIANYKFQPISAFSASKNSFIVLARFKQVKGQKDYYNHIDFSIHYLNNDLNYNKIENAEVDIDSKTGDLSIHLCLSINQYPDFEPLEYSFNSTHIPKGKTITVHLDYSKDCIGVVNSGNWPCNELNIM